MQHNEKINEIRITDMKRGKKEGKIYSSNQRWLIVTRREKLTEEKRISLDELLKENSNLQKSYLLKESLREIFLKIDYNLLRN